MFTGGAYACGSLQDKVWQALDAEECGASSRVQIVTLRAENECGEAKESPFVSKARDGMWSDHDMMANLASMKKLWRHQQVKKTEMRERQTGKSQAHTQAAASLATHSVSDASSRIKMEATGSDTSMMQPSAAQDDIATLIVQLTAIQNKIQKYQMMQPQLHSSWTPRRKRKAPTYAVQDLRWQSIGSKQISRRVQSKKSHRSKAEQQHVGAKSKVATVASVAVQRSRKNLKREESVNRTKQSVPNVAETIRPRVKRPRHGFALSSQADITGTETVQLITGDDRDITKAMISKRFIKSSLK